MLEKGCRFYEGLVRVPLVFSWPSHFEQDLMSNALVELLDITPTVLELAGLEVPDYVQRRSLLPILKGAATPDFHRESVRCEYFDAIYLDKTRSAVGPQGTVFAPVLGRGGPQRYPDGVGTFATMYRTDR